MSLDAVDVTIVSIVHSSGAGTTVQGLGEGSTFDERRWASSPATSSSSFAERRSTFWPSPTTGDDRPSGAAGLDRLADPVPSSWTYAAVYKLTYLRGPSRIVMLATELNKS
jgi:hypothetical protein